MRDRSSPKSGLVILLHVPSLQILSYARNDANNTNSNVNNGKTY